MDGATITDEIISIDPSDSFVGYNNDSCRNDKKRQPNHAVTIVGWGLDQATKMEYWIIKNSYGTSWGI